mmetsp:Transcript_107597/g.347224  ORF Transcript_107597/g.347224 Transcript_107597/m.347224 type:complete len:210 (+) Transcript_107597:1178-1807(+)
MAGGSAHDCCCVACPRPRPRLLHRHLLQPGPALPEVPGQGPLERALPRPPRGAQLRPPRAQRRGHRELPALRGRQGGARGDRQRRELGDGRLPWGPRFRVPHGCAIDSRAADGTVHRVAARPPPALAAAPGLPAEALGQRGGVARGSGAPGPGLGGRRGSLGYGGERRVGGPGPGHLRAGRPGARGEGGRRAAAHGPLHERGQPQEAAT